MITDIHPYPIARLGIIGGGQLGRMLVKAARRLGCTCTILDPVPGSPAGQVAGHQIVGSLHDPAKLRELAETCDVTTYDIENIDTATLMELEQEGCRIVPSPALLAVIQDKLLQKQALRDAGIPTADFIDLPSPSPEALAGFGFPLVQKLRRGGYDGRGVAVLRGPEDLGRILSGPSLAERFIADAREIAVLVARGGDDDIRTYPPVDMVFREGENVLDLLLAPADLAPEQEAAARHLAVGTIRALGGVGIFGVEMFLDRSGRFLVNEVAPRTHNSGHWTIEACVTDQFEQHLRAVLGLPLGATDLLSPAAMLNLLGDPSGQGRPLIRGLAAALAIPGVCVHIYGKAASQPHRKMGHVTVLDASREAARAKAEQVRQVLTITGEGHP